MSTPIRPAELNTFKLILSGLDSGSNVIYEEPIFDVSTIILSAHIANLTLESQRITIKLQKKEGKLVTMLKNAAVPPEESLNPFTGRVVLEQGDKFIVETPVSGAMEIALSILENANS
jgi:hypothetical protein